MRAYPAQLRTLHGVPPCAIRVEPDPAGEIHRDQPRLRAGEGGELEQLPRRAVRTAATHSGGELCLKLGLADALGLCD
jgi:hypothetical protein